MYGKNEPSPKTRVRMPFAGARVAMSAVCGEMRGRFAGHGCRRPWWTAACIFVIVSALAPPRPALAQALDGVSEPTVYQEDEVKAAFLYNFSTYVEWPSDSAQMITIAVLGAPAVADELARVVRGRTIQGIPVRVRRLRTISQLNDDDVVYIGPAENHRLSQLIQAVDGRPTLLVTDAPDGLARSGVARAQRRLGCL